MSYHLFKTTTGDMFHRDVWIGRGYSGFHEGKNSPASERQVGVGPIPCGAYSIGPEIESEEHGPVAMHLIPLPGTQTWGRSAFMVHGDSREHPGEASHGCIVLPRTAREQIAASPDRLLLVITGAV